MADGNSAQNERGTLFNRITHAFSKLPIETVVTPDDYTTQRGVQVIIRGLNKSFGSNHVLRDIDLAIEPGETFSIIGPSGTGKSVLLKHLVGLQRPDTGEIRIDGEDVFHEPGQEVSHSFRYSMVFQTSALFNSLTVGENIGLWLHEKQVFIPARIRRIIRDKLRLVGLGGKEELQVSELSGGMRKRVAIARSLAMNPDLILYDEPTAELDPVTTDELARVIENLKSKVDLTTIIVSHDLDFAMYLSDRVAMMHDGEIIEIGTPDEIRQSSNPIVRNFIYTKTKGLKGA